MPSRLTPVRSRKLGDLVIQQIQEKISLGIFAPGAKIPTEPTLMAQLGVGRSTVREAIRVLVSAGLLEVRQGDGTYVLDRTTGHEPLEYRLRRSTAEEIREVRRIIEVETARLAAQNRTPADIDTMREALEKKRTARAAGDSHGYVTADIAFHTAVAAASGNGLLADLYRSFSMVFQDFLDILIADRGVNQYQDRIHHGLLDAIADKDPDKAVSFAMEALDRTTSDAKALEDR
ncbi:GntR domain protein [Solidesulfovibrio carbinoliphilus subsp. oakridgensis]|uniref:GntR domain protein n=1 Tax=Solidesulfovibrio carbinoliphilus subsp. oakridgensis TaxID=694327 RepID=G7QBR8_9BACT|nr:FadR/GntR family transcriptional regulator [Solidesulfovibrio carbinoliphilus]EHJ49411.1 GntR domain protein [Solidesulfovibrio carbinoliphilus subsp. oakridgensis]